MILTKACEYGIRVVLYLAAERPPGFLSVRALSRECGVPYHFLGKICGLLTQCGVLRAHRGPNGGVALARPAEDVTLLDVVAAIDGTDAFDRCVLGLETCHHRYPCPVHDEWAPIKERIYEMLSGRNLRQFAQELAAGKTTLRQVFGSEPRQAT